MIINVCSDLHLEFEPLELRNASNADVLVLGGDILIAADFAYYNSKKHPEYARRAKEYHTFLYTVSNEYDHVIMIAGNHEYYYSSIESGSHALRTAVSQYPNISFLENETVIVDDVAFIGATLWTDLNKNCPITEYTVKSMMSDYKLISYNNRQLLPTDTYNMFQESLAYIKSEVPKYSKKVVVTHHCPSPLSIHPDYIGVRYANGGFVSNLADYIDSVDIDVWTCGHVHHSHQYKIGDTTVKCNPRGYVRHGQMENKHWESNAIIVV